MVISWLIPSVGIRCITSACGPGPSSDILKSVPLFSGWTPRELEQIALDDARTEVRRGLTPSPRRAPGGAGLSSSSRVARPTSRSRASPRGGRFKAGDYFRRDRAFSPAPTATATITAKTDMVCWGHDNPGIFRPARREPTPRSAWKLLTGDGRQASSSGADLTHRQPVASVALVEPVDSIDYLSPTRRPAPGRLAPRRGGFAKQRSTMRHGREMLTLAGAVLRAVLRTLKTPGCGSGAADLRRRESDGREALRTLALREQTAATPDPPRRSTCFEGGRRRAAAGFVIRSTGRRSAASSRVAEPRRRRSADLVPGNRAHRDGPTGQRGSRLKACRRGRLRLALLRPPLAATARLCGARWPVCGNRVKTKGLSRKRTPGTNRSSVSHSPADGERGTEEDDEDAA